VSRLFFIFFIFTSTSPFQKGFYHFCTCTTNANSRNFDGIFSQTQLPSHNKPGTHLAMAKLMNLRRQSFKAISRKSTPPMIYTKQTISRRDAIYCVVAAKASFQKAFFNRLKAKTGQSTNFGNCDRPVRFFPIREGLMSNHHCYKTIYQLQRILLLLHK
jgi:hypothetical protein